MGPSGNRSRGVISEFSAHASAVKIWSTMNPDQLLTCSHPIPRANITQVVAKHVQLMVENQFCNKFIHTFHFIADYIFRFQIQIQINKTKI